MRRITVLCIIITALLLFSVCQTGSYREVKQYSIESFLNTVSIGGSSFSHDEQTILFSSNETGIYNAYVMPVSGGDVKQLTQSDGDAIFAISFFPNDNRILYSSDRGGNEISHIHVRNEDGSIRDLTPGENERASFYDWSYDENSFFYLSNKRNPRYMDLYEMDITSFRQKMVYQNDTGYDLGDISRDKRHLVFSKAVTTNNSDMYLYDRETESMKHLSPHEGDINYNPQIFSIDSKSLYYLTDEGYEFTYLMKYDIESGQSETAEKSDWDIWYSYFSHNGKYRVTGINEDAQTVIKVYDAATNKPLSLPTMPGGSISSVNISKSEKLMTFYFNGSRSPSNLFVYNFETKKYQKLTDTMNPKIDPEDLVVGKVVRYKSFDGLEIPAVYYKPHHVKRDGKAPAIVQVHGGPGGQARIGYRATIQYLVNHGYIVIDVNNRGSSGYGKTFFKLDDMKHGEDDLQDCIEAKDFLVSTGYVDIDKIGIMGGSYGGYMVLAGLTLQPESFKVGVDLFGISNWVRTLENIPPWWESFREALYKEMGDPNTDKEYLYRISPLFHADQITKPLMVLQGANDPRVLKVESDEIVAAAKANGVPVEYVLFEDEGHGFVKKENQIEGYKAILDFLDTHLKADQESE
jgi:dipeptidyl aminopeptidase/acylaminoacyl peptidase